MKVNMTPNPLDVVTIHASQGDTEARQWSFELHNNGELIDTSEITEQLFFKAYKGGTEQLLPENGSTPTTSPFKGDIKYPQGLLTDQEFAYRQSPTEEDGLAKITDIKGNTLVWNQLVQNGNFADTSNWQTEYNATVSVSNNVLSITPTEQNGRVAQKFTYTANHKLLIMADVKLSSTSGEINRISLGAYAIDNTAQSSTRNPKQTNDWQKLYVFCYSASTHVNNRFLFTDGRTSDWGTTQIRNFMAFDLTSMFGETKANELFASEQSQVGKGLLEFTSLFSLPYYDYNAGTLLSFNGAGIKTVWKNQLPKAVEGTYTGNGITCVVDEDGTITFSGTATASGNAVIIPLETPYTIQENTYLHLRNNVANLNVAPSFENATNPGGGVNRPLAPVNAVQAIGQKAGYEITRIRLYITNGTTTNVSIKPMITFNDNESEYIPYTVSTLSLPIEEYFPDGMDGVGTDYDELTNTKASTRMARVDLGTLNWDYQASSKNFYVILNLSKTWHASVMPNIVCTRYAVHTWNGFNADGNDKIIGFAGGTKQLRVRDLSYTDVTTFKSAMSGVILVYPLATPIETSFSTASLVTENAEIPLSNDDGVLIGKCTEQLSAEPGFHDAKIKLIDGDGTCYSNKLQLHIERSPQ